MDIKFLYNHKKSYLQIICMKIKNRKIAKYEKYEKSKEPPSIWGRPNRFPITMSTPIF